MASTIEFVGVPSVTETSCTATARCYIQYGSPSPDLYVRLRFNGLNSMSADSAKFSAAAGATVTKTVSYDGLEPGTTYTCEVILYNASGQVAKDSTTITTDSSLNPPTDYGDLVVSDIGITTATIDMDPIRGADAYKISYRKASTTKDTIIRTIYTTYTLTGLSPDTDYVVNYRGTNADGDGPLMPTGVRFTTKASVTPWDWNRSNGSATATQTQTAYGTVTSRGPLSDFSYKVWNDLCSKTLEVMTSRNLSWVNTYGSYAETKMSSSDKRMTARRFNALRWNLGQMVSTGTPEVASGDIIMGRYFTQFATAINNSIV